MMNPQNLSGKCCLSPLNNRVKGSTNQAVNQLHKDKKQKQSKISLKNYCSGPKNIRSQFKPFSVKQPNSPTKTIIQKLQRSETNLGKDQLRPKNSDDPMSSKLITIKELGVKLQPYQPNYLLLKSKSLTKINFTYFGCDQVCHKNSNTLRKLQKNIKSAEYPSDFTEQQNQPQEFQINSHKKNDFGKFNKPSMEKLEDEDMRSTMDLFLELPKPSVRSAKSIVSIQDAEEMEEWMKESVVIEKHSESKKTLKLL